MSRLLNHIFIKEYCEHCEIPIPRIDIEYSLQRKVIAFQNNSDYPCISITEENDKYNLKSGYFVGVDWISEELAIYIPPKLDKQNPPTDYLAMFFLVLDIQKSMSIRMTYMRLSSMSLISR